MFDRDITVRNDKDRATRVRLSKFRRNKNGEEAETGKVVTKVNRGNKSKTLEGLIVKSYQEKVKEGRQYPESEVGMQQQKWRRLKDLGIPVVNTFRIDKEKQIILMTDVTENGSKHYFNADKPISKKFRKIVNKDDIIQQVKEIAVRSYNNGSGLYLEVDAYALVIDEDGQATVMIVDVGQGSVLLKDGKEENTETPYSLEESQGAAELFLDTVLREATPPNFYWGG